MRLPTRTSARVCVFVLTINLLFLAATVLYCPSRRLRTIYNSINNITKGEKSLLTSQLQILLITYGRSGSTFTSDIIRHSQDVFYVFEPLSILQTQEEASVRKADLPKYWINNKKEQSLRIVEAFLACNFELIALEMLNNVHLKRSESTKKFYKCMHKLRKESSHLQCFFDLYRTCRSHHMTFIKTIRLRPHWAEYLMLKYPSLKLIYLVRDPRATLYSQAKTFRKFNFQWSIKNVSTSHCGILGEDLEAVRLLQERFPGRVKAMRYEHGATDPLGYTAVIYRFLGLTVTSEVTDYVKSLTTPQDLGTDNTKRPKNIAYMTHRDNPRNAMQHWRHETGIKEVRAMDSQCSHLYGKMGYRTVATQAQLKNTDTIDLNVSPESGGIFGDSENWGG